MNVTAWRIVKPSLARGAFSGDGARLAGGRWNSRGTSVVYLSQSISLAMLEVLVHVPSPELLDSFVLYEVSFADDLVRRLLDKDLPPAWRASPPHPRAQAVGDAFVAAAREPVLRVPSAVVPREFNYVLNPAHPQFRSIKLGPMEPIEFDPRLHRTSRQQGK